MLQSRLPKFVASHYECHEWRHASAILSQDFPAEWADLMALLTGFRLLKSWITIGGGNKTRLAAHIDSFLGARGWVEQQFHTAIEVDGTRKATPTHKVDCYRNRIALELEWNNKDPFFDRDLENFQRLHMQGAISAGVLVTRGARLQAAMVGIVAAAVRTAGIVDATELASWGVKERTARQRKNLAALLERQVPFAEAFARSFVSDKYGMATTHWSKLVDRINRGVGNPCPLLLIGLPLEAVSDYSAATAEL